MSQTVRVVTINLLKTAARWDQRLPLLAAGLQAFQPDLIGLQEVAIRSGGSTAHDLADKLEGYQVTLAPRGGWWRRGEGVAMLSRLPIHGHEFIHLGGGEGRTVQFIQVEVAGRPLILANGHYLWRPLADSARVRQVEQVLAQFRAYPPDALFVACGDFNAVPESKAIIAARRILTSAYRASHGYEPDFTCPTPLEHGHWLRDTVSNLIFRLASNRPDGPWRATLDYIFVSPSIRVVTCEVCLNQPSVTNSTLYPSDHFGLVAALEVAPNETRERTAGPLPLA